MPFNVDVVLLLPVAFVSHLRYIPGRSKQSSYTDDTFLIHQLAIFLSLSFSFAFSGLMACVSVSLSLSLSVLMVLHVKPLWLMADSSFFWERETMWLHLFGCTRLPKITVSDRTQQIEFGGSLCLCVCVCVCVCFGGGVLGSPRIPLLAHRLPVDKEHIIYFRK